MIPASKLRVLYIQYTRPEAWAPVEQSLRILTSQGWEALLLGTEADGGANALSFPPLPSITVRRLPRCRPGWYQKLHYLRFCLWALYWTWRWRPEWIYASDPLSCPAAALLNVFGRAKVVYHEHDSPGTEGLGAFQYLCLVARRFLARRASICVLPNPDRAARIASELGIEDRVVCVWNCPSREEALLPTGGQDRTDFLLVYQGSITAARLPVSVLEGLRMLPERVKLRVVGYEAPGSPGYLSHLRDVAVRLGVERRIEFLGTLRTRKELLEHCRECDIGLALMPRSTDDMNLRWMVGASGKSFDYLACGLALLVSDQAAWRETFVDAGYGLACNPDDPLSIASVVRWFLEHPQEVRAMGEKGRLRILGEWNYEWQYRPVLDTLSGGGKTVHVRAL